MSTKKIQNLLDYIYDLDELKNVQNYVWKRIKEVEKAEQDQKDAATWERLRHVKIGDRIYPGKKIDIGLHSQMLIEPGDYLIVAYVYPRAHALWLRKKDVPQPTNAEWKKAEDRMDVLYCRMYEAGLWQLNTEVPVVDAEVRR